MEFTQTEVAPIKAGAGKALTEAIIAVLAGEVQEPNVAST